MKQQKAAFFARSDYHSTQEKLREGWKSEGRAFTSSAEASDLLDDVEFARRDMFGVAAENEEDAPRLVSFQQSRLYGLHDRIVRKVARWASWRFGKPVTPSVVQRTWKALGPHV